MTFGTGLGPSGGQYPAVNNVWQRFDASAKYRFDPDLVHRWGWKGDVYAKLGKTREAITQWQASLKQFQTASPADADPEEVAKVSKKLDDARVKLARESKK